MIELPRAKKSLGQNFLIDQRVLARIIETSAISGEDYVLEVGPGQGALTRLLAQKAREVICVELDRRLVEFLREELSQSSTVEIVQGDILKVDIASLLPSHFEGRWKVVANLPYNISSQVLFRFIDNHQLFSTLVLMLQKEVGERLVADPGGKDYGILSVFCSLYFDMSKEFIVKPGCFRPIPKVDSVVLKFTTLPKPRVDVGNERFFRRVVKAAFSQRRKTLWNCLKAGDLGPSDEAIRETLAECSIKPERRGETLTLEEFAHLSRALESRL